jgi:hypothetical protein
MGISVATPSVAIDRLERRAGRKRRKKNRRGDAMPIVNTRNGGGKKSKRKGASFEKTVAGLFSAYFGCSVRRTPGSGGWATVGDFGPRGDLVFAITRAPYHVECKKHEGWELEDLITFKRGVDTTSTNSVEKWWKQTIRDRPEKKIPMLVFARNGLEPLLMLYTHDLVKLEKRGVKGMGDNAPWSTAGFIRQLHLVDDVEAQRSVLRLADLFKYIRPPKSSPRREAWIHGKG